MDYVPMCKDMRIGMGMDDGVEGSGAAQGN